MTKKIFTLLAAVAFCASGVVNAQIAVGTQHTSALKQGGLYHVSDGTNYLYVGGTDGNELMYGKTTTLAPGLWCVTADQPTGALYPEFAFVNKGMDVELGIDLSAYYADPSVTVFPAVLDASDVSVWRFSSKYKTEMDAAGTYLMSYIGNDTVAVLTQDAAGIVYVELIKAPGVGTTPVIAKTALTLSLYNAAPIVLDAPAFNTLFSSTTSTAAKGFNFIDPASSTLASSPLKDKFVASASGTTDYLLLADAATATKYLRVDTAVYNTTGDPYLKFAYSTATEYAALAAASDLQQQHFFRLIYLPSADSLIINVHSVNKPEKGNNVTPGNDWTLWTRQSSTDALADIAIGHNKSASTTVKDKTYVVVQNLESASACLTIGQVPVQVHIGLGFTGCEVSDNRITTDEGLYIIKNATGKYLQVPIYTDTATTTTQVAKWVTLEETVDPNQMPSFQWVVQKVRSSDPNKISKLTITNREYKGVVFGGVQLYSDEKTSIAGEDIAANAAGFSEVAKEYRENPYLGYKYVAKDVTTISTYTLNYLHSFNDSKYLSVKNSKDDPRLYIQDDADAFEMIPQSADPVKYGMQPAWTTSGYAAQLVRTAYVLKTKDSNKLSNTNKVVTVDSEGRYAVSGEATAKPAIFFLKTNNTKEIENGIKNYYALVDTGSFFASTNPGMISVKAGVTDDNVWVKVQNHYEVRTSAFAIEQNESPLYRRFNRTTDGAIGSDSFYNGPVGSDNPDTLRFFRMNNAKEFLYEDANSTYSKGKGINFLGVKHEADFNVTGDKLASATALYVDTAYVARPATAGASYDTPKPQYLIGVGVTKVEGSTIEIPCEPSVTTPFYKRGRYLINATDSVYGVGANWASNWSSTATNVVKNSNYIWDTKWERLAFVDAVHLYDTLYILNGQTYADPVDFTALKADTKVRAIRLDNNFHKDVVFSFRLIDDERTIDYKDQIQNFLIESETTARGTTPVFAPDNGGWVKIQNGVPVISRGAYLNAITEAERFNVVKTDADPVANEDINVVDFKVVAGEGAITILNAAGKNVVVSNILGQVVANTVLTSDNATIVAPKGIVVVAVAGESAVKAIVK